MRDGLPVRVVKRVVLWHFYVNVVVHRALDRKSRYRLAGECRRCAKCCEAPSIQVGVLVWHVRFLRRLFLWWQRRVNGFELATRHPLDRVFEFRCSHFDWETRSCDSYDSRPGMCRDYPKALLDHASPEFFSECGYRPIAPNADSLLRELEHQDLSQDQLVQLKNRLHLE